MSGPGPVGYIFHNASGKLVRSADGSYNPPNDTNIVLNSDNSGPGRLQFRFVPDNGEWGYIEHISSGKVIHPKGIYSTFS